MGRYAETAAARDIEIRVLPYDAPDLVRGDRSELLAMIGELLENAVVYSRDGGLVRGGPRVG